MRSELETVIVEFDDETGIGRITLNRPDKLNAMNSQMRDDIAAALDELGTQDDAADGLAVRVVVIEGAGDRAFSAGADINEFSDSTRQAFTSHGTQETLQDFPAPVVAKIDGYCLGGGLETALACDLRFASDRSTLGFPEVDLGILPGAGGVQYVSRLAGPAVATELAMTGDHISADRAAEIGILNDVYATETFEEEVEGFVDQLAGQPPLALRGIKESAKAAVQMNRKEARDYDAQLFSQLLKTEDHKEGAKAFQDDDYEPEFTGK
ncbi:MAG: enoyl-CoA hydratase/isomerase family protein [Halobacteriales archaeon]